MEEMTGVARLRQAITNHRLCRECKDELARLAWAEGVPAPVDADGNVVPLTTKVVYDDGGEELTVRLICYRQSDGGWVAELCRPCAAVMDTLIKFHLSRPDSWEQLEEDIWKVVENDVCGYFDKSGKSCDGCPAHRTQGSCLPVVRHDVMRRAKALAERDANGCNEERGRM